MMDRFTFQDTSPNAVMTRRSAAGVVRRLELCQIQGGNYPRLDQIVHDLVSNAGPDGDDEYALRIETSEGTIITGIVVDLPYFGEDGKPGRQGTAIVDAWRAEKSDKGSILYPSRTGAHVAVIFRQNISDAALADAAHGGAAVALKCFLAKHRLLQREYRPGRLSEGYNVEWDHVLFRPAPCARGSDGQRYPTALHVSGELYSPHDLAALLEDSDARTR